MSDRALRISRRKLLKLSSIAPFAGLLVNGGSVAAFAAAMENVPPEIGEDLLDEAHQNGHNPNPDVFKPIAKLLWQFVEAGAQMGSLGVPSDLTKKRKLARDAYKQKTNGETGEQSGNLIMKELSGWSTDDAESWKPLQSATLGCAYLCGFYSAEAALADGTEIDKKAYAKGFKKTKDQMDKTLARLRSRQKDATQEVGILAAGC